MSNINSYPSSNQPEGQTYTRKDNNKSPYYSTFYPSDTELGYHTQNDFFNYSSGNWTITNASAGTLALADEDGGALLITNGASQNNFIGIQSVAQSFSFTAGKRMVFDTRLKVSDAVNTDIVAGLQIRDTTPLAVSDGVYFYKATGSANVSLILAKSSVLTTIANITTLANNTYKRLSYYYNGIDTIEYYADGVKLGTVSNLTNLPTSTLCLSYAVNNGTAGAKTMSLDYYEIMKARLA